MKTETRKVSPPRRFWRFAYLEDLKPRRGPIERFPVRDGEAFAEIQAALHSRGYVYADLLINQLGSDFSKVAFGPQDLVVVTTRIPLDDDRRDRKRIDRTRTRFERLVHDAARAYLETCRRSLVTLQPEVIRKLKYRDRGEMVFHVHGFGRYKRHRDPHGGHAEGRWVYRRRDEYVTAGFVIRTPLGPNGPDLLAVFGMDGVLTHAWCHLVRREHPNLLEKPGLTLAEITFKPLRPRPTTLDFVRDWQVEILVESGAIAPVLQEA